MSLRPAWSWPCNQNLKKPMRSYLEKSKKSLSSEIMPAAMLAVSLVLEDGWSREKREGGESRIIVKSLVPLNEFEVLVDDHGKGEVLWADVGAVAARGAVKITK